MTDIKRAGAIISAYTGIALPGTEHPSNFADMHEYVDSLPGFSGIGNISFGIPSVFEAIRRAAKPDFWALLMVAGEPLAPWHFAPDEFPPGDRVLALFERIKRRALAHPASPAAGKEATRE